VVTRSSSAACARTVWAGAVGVALGPGTRFRLVPLRYGAGQIASN
jgi:hypothetical protein